MAQPSGKPFASYLGDSVYARYDGYSITLTTENGEGASNTIVIEPATLVALFEFVKYLNAQAAKADAQAALVEAEAPANIDERM